MTRNWSTQNPNPTPKTKTGNNLNNKWTIRHNTNRTCGQPSAQLFPKRWPHSNLNQTRNILYILDARKTLKWYKWLPCLVLSIIKQALASFLSQMSRVMRKPDFCIWENKDADQLRGNREADQRLCFHYMDSTIPLLPKYEITSLIIFCDCTARFVWDLVRNPEDRFSHNEAQISHSNCTADQRLCFNYIDSTIPLLSISYVSSL